MLLHVRIPFVFQSLAPSLLVVCRSFSTPDPVHLHPSKLYVQPAAYNFGAGYSLF